MINARTTALEMLIKFEDDKGYSNIILDKTFKQSELDSRDKAFAATLFYGVIEKKITLDYIIKSFSKGENRLKKTVRKNLQMALYQILYLDKIPQSAAVNEAIKILEGTKYYYAKGYTNGLLRSVIRALPLDMNFPEISDENKRLSVKYSFPEKLIEHFKKSYNEDIEDLLGAMSEHPSTAIRVNTLRTDKEKLKALLEEEGIETAYGNLENSLFIKNYGSIEKIQAFQDGLFHVEDESAQLAAEAVKASPGERILDFCAAPGGKSFTMAENMHNSGEIISNDIHENKLTLIAGGAKRLGINIIKPFCSDASEESVFRNFNKVLCDVPCSGLGIIQKKPEIKYKNLDSLDFLTKLQYLILCRGSACLKTGGLLVYSTCTLNPDENENNISAFLSEHTNFEKTDEKTYFPHIDKSDGFYIAVLKKIGD